MPPGSPKWQRRFQLDLQREWFLCRRPDPWPHRLRELGQRGVLIEAAELGLITELRCSMPECHCPEGRFHFEPKTHPPTLWAPSADHYPILERDGGHLVPQNAGEKAGSRATVSFNDRWSERQAVSRPGRDKRLSDGSSMHQTVSSICRIQPARQPDRTRL